MTAGVQTFRFGHLNLSTTETIMFNGIKQRVTVGKGGRVEFLSPELPEGVTVEIIVLIHDFRLN
jgi:hypothetical protein